MKHFTLLLLACLSTVSLTAQDTTLSVLASAGDSYSDDQIKISWTLGEIAVETYEAGELILTQGFQQANLSVTRVTDQTPSYVLKAYPNPVMDMLILETSETGVPYQLIDARGITVRQGFTSSTREQLDFSGLAPGIYYLQERDRKAYKIIKQ